MPNIHPTAVVDPKAKIDASAIIGPHCVIGPDVTIGPECNLIALCYIAGHTTLGANNMVYPGASIGAPPQDTSFDLSKTSYVQIGSNNVFRENISIHRGSKEFSITKVGNDCYIMANTHIAHDCQLGNNIVMVNFAGLAGYVTLGDGCFLSGNAVIHQFCSVGRFSMLSGVSAISKDLPPFMIADGRNGAVRSVNIIAMRRNGFSNKAIRAIKDVYNIFYRGDLNVKNAIEKIKSELEQTPEVIEFVSFVENSERGVLSQGVAKGRRD